MIRSSGRSIFTYATLGAVIIFIALAFIFVYLIPADQSISTSEYKITKYDVVANVNGGNTYDITETITANFLEYKHGIYRTLPVNQEIMLEKDGKTYKKSYNLSYSNVSATKMVDAFEKDNCFIIQVGDAMYPEMGSHTYTIFYTVEIGDDKIPDFDFFYYNLIGNQWDTTISNISIGVNFGSNTGNSSVKVFVGGYAEDSVGQTVSMSGNSFSFNYSGTLQPYSGITALAFFDEGYFETQKQSIALDVVILIASVLVLAGIGIWFSKKNNKEQPVQVVEFTAPDDITSADAGYLIDRTINRGDIASLVVYWANKGYIKITEIDGKTTLEKIKDAGNNFKEYETEVFNSLFAKSKTVHLADENLTLAIAIKDAKVQVKQENDKKYFNQGLIAMKNLIPFLFTALCFFTFWCVGAKLDMMIFNWLGSLFFATLMGVGVGIILSAQTQKLTLTKFTYSLLMFLGIGLTLGIYLLVAIKSFDMYSNSLMLTIFVPLISFILIIFALKINPRTKEGNLKVGQILGLRQFILVTEQDRLKMLAKENPSMFYDVLPFAYVLGVSDIWIKKFAIIEVELPEWYQGNNNIFVGYCLLNSITRTNDYMVRSTVKSLQNKRSAGGGGFSGGFSGGGFGGGGGGSW